MQRIPQQHNVLVEDPLKTLPEYDEQLRQDQKLPTVSQRPTSDVVHPITN
jgi:hypothetical protein